MKRYGNLFDEICCFENLLLAARKAQRGKRGRPNVARFNLELEKELPALRKELLSGTYQPGPYDEFYITDRKRRLISAAPYRDRVVHHAFCNIVEPIFEATFIHDSYACRKGKGTHLAVDRLQQFMQSNRYVLKCDVRQYFPSMDQAVLMDCLARKIKCQRTLELADTILTHANEQGGDMAYFPGDDLFTPQERRRGVPIGNQTSQFFANLYLNPFDHFMKEILGCRFYLRYVDDFLVLGTEKERLHEVLRRAEEFLSTLRLRLHPNKCQVFPVTESIEFLGYRVFPTHRRLRSDNPRHYGRRLRAKRKAYTAGKMQTEDLRRSIHAWIGHAQHADTKRLRRDVISSVVFSRGQTG